MLRSIGFVSRAATGLRLRAFAVAPARALSGSSLTPTDKKRAGGGGGGGKKADDLASVLAKEIAYEAEEGSTESAISGLAASLKAASGFELTGASSSLLLRFYARAGGRVSRATTPAAS